jgi:hypothetical protein
VFGHFYPVDPGVGEEYVDVALMVSLSKTPLFYRVIKLFAAQLLFWGYHVKC